MKTANLSDAELAAYSGQHLLYELQMFLWTAGELQRSAKDDAVRVVLTESFVIHLRNLIDFFYSSRQKEDDVIAGDFCPEWNESMPPTLRVARERANKELSHLTLERKSDGDEAKRWDVGARFQEIHAVATRFAGKASLAKLSPEVPKLLGLSQGIAVAVPESFTSTSFATSTISIVSSPKV